ncbi:hypothetical protein [Mycobacterium sp. OAE908]|uniref:hypothetical protein n=1 Tax=Mycobacterium sp. OAE908 TaxID=2817899 RepID=UPI001AE33D40
MQVASRPRFTTGVALVGASLVVASTVAPVADVHLPDIHLPAIRTMDVDLTAAVNPLAIYSQVLHDALTNVSTLAENAKPGQVLQAILANQLNSAGTLGAALGATGGAVGGALAQLPQTVQTAVGQLAAGNVAGAANALLQIPLTLGLPLQDILPALATIITKPLENIVNVVKAFTGDTLGTELILAGFIGPLISTPAAAATAVQNVITAVGTGNPMAVVGALLGAPATVADGLLNGGYGPDLGPLVDSPFPVKAGGLLSSSTLVFNPDGSFFVNTGGPIAALQAALAKIAGALAPKTPVAVKTADVASVPSTAATTVTVSTGVPAPTKEATTAVEATAPKPSSNGSTTSESPSTTTDSKSQTASTTKPTETGVDVTSGNKVEPKPASGSDVTKAGDATESPTQEATTEKTDTSSAADAAPSGSAAKSVEKSAGTAKHAKAK